MRLTEHLNRLLGAITWRAGLHLSSLRKRRREIVPGEVRPRALADPGPAVLDTAMAETSACGLELAS